MTFRLANIGGRSALVDDQGAWFDAARVSGGAVSANPMAALSNLAALHEAAGRLAAATANGQLNDADIGPPVPTPCNVFGIGLNYRPHAEEANMEIPEVPLVFSKFAGCIVGPDHAVKLRGTTVDWEVELVVVIGVAGRDIPADRAWDHVAGLTIGQDISDRRQQFAAKPPHFDLGKSGDGYGPIGPTMISTDAVDDPTDLAITCDINGTRKQDDRTASLIFSVAELIEYLSGILTLRVGDLIFTGTPAGVGATDRTFLKPGDVITSTVEGIGTLRTTCV